MRRTRRHLSCSRLRLGCGASLHELARGILGAVACRRAARMVRPASFDAIVCKPSKRATTCTAAIVLTACYAGDSRACEALSLVITPRLCRQAHIELRYQPSEATGVQHPNAHTHCRKRAGVNAMLATSKQWSRRVLK